MPIFNALEAEDAATSKWWRQQPLSRSSRTGKKTLDPFSIINNVKSIMHTNGTRKSRYVHNSSNIQLSHLLRMRISNETKSCQYMR
ncbi:hypothetical protein P8452_49409 [Trifolium repens]|nr:hypothetical protein P8452_49409 [Trifolium repens]